MISAVSQLPFIIKVYAIRATSLQKIFSRGIKTITKQFLCIVDRFKKLGICY